MRIVFSHLLLLIKKEKQFLVLVLSYLFVHVQDIEKEIRKEVDEAQCSSQSEKPIVFTF